MSIKMNCILMSTTITSLAWWTSVVGIHLNCDLNNSIQWLHAWVWQVAAPEPLYEVFMSILSASTVSPRPRTTQRVLIPEGPGLGSISILPRPPGTGELSGLVCLKCTVPDPVAIWPITSGTAGRRGRQLAQVGSESGATIGSGPWS